MILGLLRSLGQADVDRKGASLKFKSADVDEKGDALRFIWTNAGPGKAFEPIKREKVLSVLGTPLQIAHSNLSYSCLYKYVFAGRASASAWAKFVFADGADTLQSSEGALSNVGWKLTALDGNHGMQGLIFFRRPEPAPDPVAIQLGEQIAQDYVGQYQAAFGEVLRIGRDGEMLAADAGHSSSDPARHGWWRLTPQSLTNFVGRGLGFCFVRDAGGQVNHLQVSEHGFDAEFRRISNDGPKQPAIIRLDPQIADRYTGQYRAEWSGETIGVTREGEQLLWAGIKIYPTSETDFSFKLAEMSLTFVKNGKGVVTGFTLHYLTENPTARKLK